MPIANRDKESLYPPGKLSLWFLGTSAVLVVAVFWMLADDFIRPWKGVQREFFRKQASLLEVKRDVEESKISAADSDKQVKLRDLQRRIAAARQGLDATAIRTLEAEVAEQTLRVENDERQIKALKGSYAATVNEFELATSGGDKAAATKLKARVDSLADAMDKLVRDRVVQVVARSDAQAKLDASLAPVRVLEKERDGYVADLALVSTALEGARAKTERNQWRNLPMADIIDPSIKIEKVVLDQIHDDLVFATSPKVDMCMTCHRGIDNALLSAGENDPARGVGALVAGFLRLRLGEKAWKSLKDEPKFLEKTAPANVRAWLTGPKARLSDVFTDEQLKKALGDENYRKEIEGKDLLAAFRIDAVHWAHPHLDLMVGPASAHKMNDVGCTVCHAGVGRRLDFTRATHTPGSKEQAHEWEHEHGWSHAGAEYVDFPMVPLDLVEGQCIKCHGAVDPFKPASEALRRYEAVLDKDGRPVLDRNGNPGIDPKTGRQVFDDAGLPFLDKDGRPVLQRLKAPKPVDGWTTSGDGKWTAQTLARGVNTMQEWGCGGCHLIKDFEKRPGFGDGTSVVSDLNPDLSRPRAGSLTAAGNPKMGPDVTHVGDKTTIEWVQRWIGSPNSYRIDTRMPSFYRWRAHDDRYVALPGPDQPIVVDPTQKDLDQMDVEVYALASFLIGDSKTRATTYPEIPAGDVKRGAKTFHTAGCYGCHVGPGSYDLAKGEWADGLVDDGARFKGELAPGPRLTAIGSKYKDPRMLAAWIAEPRHYNSVTRMPNLLQGLPEMSADNKTVVRSEAQIRADLAAYLMAFKDAAFEGQELASARWSERHDLILNDFWIEWYGKKDLANETKLITVEAALDVAKKRDKNDKLREVGRKIAGMRGCYGCHNITGYEKEQPIGKELTHEGSQDLHKFDFGVIAHEEIPHTRWDWIENKLANPRIYDKGRFKPQWQDKLRMPKFNFASSDRRAVVGAVLGLVKEPIKSGALPKANATSDALARGRAVVERYGCNQCHTIEGRRGVLTAEQADRGLELWMLPPNLYGEGGRVRAEWLFQFLKSPYAHRPDGIRPAVIQRMPMFRLLDDEVTALVDYFNALAQRKDRLATDPDDEPLDDTPYKEPVTLSIKEKDADGKEVVRELVVTSLRDEAKQFFDKAGCIKCHLPKGSPVTASGEGASAPPFTLAAARLQRAWMFDLLHNPQYQIQGTKMPSFWPGLSVRGKPAPAPNSMSVTYPQFLLGARFKERPTNDEIAEAQMGAIVRYLRFHYQAPAAAVTSPPEPGK